MEMEFLEIMYHLSGILVALFFLLVVNILRKENQAAIKSRIFLKYDKFKMAFYIAFAGTIFFLVGNILGLYNHESFHWIHDLTEVIYNLCLAAFIVMIYFIIKTKKTEVDEDDAYMV